MSLIEEALKKSRLVAAAQPERSVATRNPSESEAAPAPQVRRHLGDPSRLKSLNREALRQDGLLPPEREARQIEHQFRTIKRPLIRSAFASPSEPVATELSQGQRAIMISSALPGDGKTFTSLNLALSMALEMDHSVILVDGDVAKPHISKLFGADEERGLLDVLKNPAMSVESVLLPTNVPGLSIVPVGQQSERATELLASARMKAVIVELQSLDSRAIVLVDSPPILLTSEARVLSSLFGQVLLVIRAGGTPQQAVVDAIKHIGDGVNISLVLNQAAHADTGGYYGYGYGAKYGTSAREAQE